MAELQRLLLSPKRIIILLMIAVVNLAMFSGFCRTRREEDIAYYNSMRMWGINTKLNEHQKTEKYLKEDYPAYLEYVQNQSQAQSILSSLTEKSAYINRNLERTAKTYRRLTGIQLRNGENRGINAVKDYAITDYLLLIAPLLLILEMLADAEMAVGDLTRSTKHGRVPLCAWRILAVILISAASVVMLYGGNILFTCKFYGNPGFLRPIQSIPEYQVCALRVTVGGYLFAAGCMKTLALSVISLIVWVTLARFHPIMGWSLSAVWLGGAYLLYRLIVPTSGINHLKFLNVFAALDADIFFTQYCNLNWFAHPSGFLGDMLIFCILLFLVAALLCLWLIGASYPKKLGQRMETIKEKLAKFQTKHLPVHSLFGCEGWKLLIAQKGLLLLLITGLLGFSLWRDIHIYVPVNSVTERFYSQYSGEVTQEKIKRAAYIVVGEARSIKHSQIALAKAYLNHEPDREISRIQANITKTQNDLKQYSQLLNAMLKVARYQRDTGRPAWFIQQNSYIILFQESAAERRCCMVLLLYLIFAFSGIRAYDNRYETRMLLRSTKRGRTGILRAQSFWILFLTLIAVTGLHGVYLLHLLSDVGFPDLNAPAQSLEMLRRIPFRITLRSCIVLHFVLRELAALVLTAIICIISKYSRTPQKSLLIAMVILLLPSALAESGITQMNHFDFVHFLTCCLRK